MQDALAVVLGISGDTFRLDDSWASVEVDDHLQVKQWIFELPCWLDELVEINRVVKAAEVRQASDSVNVVVFAEL